MLFLIFEPSLILLVSSLLYQNVKILGFTNILEGYVKKPNRWCNPYQLMNAKTLSGAITECLDTPSCDMFSDEGGRGNRFFACENTASIKGSTIGSVLYQKDGNKVNTQF